MDQFFILAIILGVFVGLAVLGFTLHGRRRRRARLGRDGVQDQEIVVLDGYTPDVVIVREGIPLRLRFTRLENEECSSRVVFSDFKLDRRLPAYRTTAVEFLPPGRGEYLFTCTQGMYQGKLIVESAARYRLSWPWCSAETRGERPGTSPEKERRSC